MTCPCCRRLIAVLSALVVLGGVAALLSARPPERAAPAAPPAEKTLAAGAKVTTGPGGPRRVVLRHETVVYLQERAAIEVKDTGDVALTAGEAFFEAAGALKVSALKRQLTAKGGRFGVRTGDD